MKPLKIRIVYAEGQTMMRGFVTAHIESNKRFKVVAAVGTGKAALEAVELHQPDILLLEIGLPEMNGHEVIDILKEKNSPVPVIVLSMYDSEKMKVHLLRKKVRGFVSKDSPADEIFEAIDTVLHGRKHWPAEIIEKVMDMNDKEFKAKYVTGKDLDMMEAFRDGLGSEEVGLRIGKNTREVDTMKSHLIPKMDAESFHDALVVASHKGFIFLRNWGKGE